MQQNGWHLCSPKLDDCREKGQEGFSHNKLSQMRAFGSRCHLRRRWPAASIPRWSGRATRPAFFRVERWWGVACRLPRPFGFSLKDTKSKVVSLKSLRWKTISVTCTREIEKFTHSPSQAFLQC